MPHRSHRTRTAVARRDSSLSRTRKLTLSILGSAAAATLGLGTAFAHALPGHSYTTTPSRGTGSSATTGTAGTPAARTAGTPAGGGSTGTSSGPAASSTGAGHGGGSSSHQTGLTRPKHNPVAAPARGSTPAPVVSSGGS
jgi:hypothetical protein